MDFPYNKILRQAYSITKQNKFLWGFGLFLVFFPVIWFFAFWFKAGLITSIREVVNKRETNLAKSLSLGSNFFGRIGFLGLLLAVFLGAVNWLLLKPQPSQGANLFAILVYAIIGLTVIAVVELAAVFVVFHDLKTKDSLNSALDLVSKHWLTLIVLSLILLAVSSVFPSVAAVVFFRFYGNINMALAAVFFLLCSAGPLVFSQVCWVLGFQELVKPVKLEEDEQPIAVPEVASS